MGVGGLAMAVAIVVVLVVQHHRKRTARRRAEEQLRAPGGSEETAFEVLGLTEIDDIVERQACVCGGGFRNIGERSSFHGGRSLRIVSLECARCEYQRRLFFAEPPTRH